MQLHEKIRDYIAKRAQQKLEVFDKAADKQAKALAQDDVSPFMAACAQERAALAATFEPLPWIDDAAMRACGIRVATHPLKFTHPEAQGSSIFAFASATQVEEGTVQLLHSGSIPTPDYDIVGNAALQDVGKFLLLRDEGGYLVDYLVRGDVSPLQPFADTQERLQTWLDGFRKAVVADRPSSHTLARQVYFPLGNGEYHLLAPLFSSTLAQAIHDRISHWRYGDEAKQARKDRREGKPSTYPVVNFPNLALQGFGGSKPQNISALNSSRRGDCYLLSSRPPVWRRLAKPPLGAADCFSQVFERRVRQEVKRLQAFLLKVQPLDSLMDIRQKRDELVRAIIAELISFVRAINQEHEPGWTAQADCRLPLHQQLLLDQGRAGLKDGERPRYPDFAQEFASLDWWRPVCRDFGVWMNAVLRHKKLALGDVEGGLWTAQLAAERPYFVLERRGG